MRTPSPFSITPIVPSAFGVFVHLKKGRRFLIFSVRSAYQHHIVLLLSRPIPSMNTTESSESKDEQYSVSTEGSIGTASAAEPIKKTRLFSLACPPRPIAGPAVIRSGSTQVNFTPSSFPSSQNLVTSNSSFELYQPSRRLRREAYEERALADPYYSPPSTFIPPESPNDMKVQDQTTLAAFSSEAQVRQPYLLITYNTNK